jgi:hypothetical protein
VRTREEGVIELQASKCYDTNISGGYGYSQRHTNNQQDATDVFKAKLCICDTKYPPYIIFGAKDEFEESLRELPSLLAIHYDATPPEKYTKVVDLVTSICSNHNMLHNVSKLKCVEL